MREKKYALYNWNIVCTSKDQGGLGIPDLKLMSEVLLAKWLWKFYNTKDRRLWKEILTLDTLIGDHLYIFLPSGKKFLEKNRPLM